MHTQQPSTHAAPPPTRSPRQCFSAVASDRRSRPLISPNAMEDIVGVQSAAAPPTAAAFQLHPPPWYHRHDWRGETSLLDLRTLSSCKTLIKRSFSVILGRDPGSIPGKGSMSERKISPERGRKQTSDLDFTNACWRRTIRAFTMLFYFRLMYGYCWPAEVSGATSLVLFCFVFPRKQGCIRERERRLQLPREPVSHPDCLTHRDPCSIPRLRIHDLEALIYLSLKLSGIRGEHRHS